MRHSTILLISLALGGCSNDNSGNQISTSQAQTIWSSANTAITTVQGQMVPALQQKEGGKGDLPGPDGGLDRRDGGKLLGDGGDGGGWVSGTITSFQVHGTVTNPNGAGTATVTGSGGTQVGGWGVKLTVTFSGWDTGAGMVINGPLSLDYTLTKLLPLDMTLRVTGTLQTTIGKLTLPAAVDVKVQVSGTTTTVCGMVAGTPVGSGACPK